MKVTYKGKKISSILTILPETETTFEDTLKAENLSRARRLKKIMGFDKRRRVKKDTNISDMHFFGIKHLLDKNQLKKDDIGAIVVVTLTQDFLVPHVSEIIHGELDLSQDVICVDIAQGCSGYVMGVMESFGLLEHLGEKKVLLCTGDILNRINDNEEKVEEPQFGGDAATISVIENDDSFGEAFFEYYSDGKSGKDLIMPGGAFKHPMYDRNDTTVTLEDGRTGYGLGIWMDGSDVFNFIQKEVPPLFESVFNYAGCSVDDIEFFFCHQPNRYILEKLADRAGVPREKMPMRTTEKYGNSNSSTIPVTITDSAKDDMMGDRKKCVISGFGSGLSWTAAVLEMGDMKNCEMIVSNL